MAEIFYVFIVMEDTQLYAFSKFLVMYTIGNELCCMQITSKMDLKKFLAKASSLQIQSIPRKGVGKVTGFK